MGRRDGERAGRAGRGAHHPGREDHAGHGRAVAGEVGERVAEVALFAGRRVARVLHHARVVALALLARELRDGDRRQRADDGDHHQELDEREAGLAVPRRAHAGLSKPGARAKNTLVSGFSRPGRHPLAGGGNRLTVPRALGRTPGPGLPDQCSSASLSVPHGNAAGSARPRPFPRRPITAPGTPVAPRAATMRALLPGLVCCALLVAPAAAAGPRRCGDDVGGRAVPCDCGDVLTGSRTLGADDPITSRVCPGSGLLVAVPTGAPAARLALGGHVLAGSGRGVGIQVVGGGAGGLTIAGPGGVRGFATGVQAVNGTLARLADVVAADNAADV